MGESIWRYCIVIDESAHELLLFSKRRQKSIFVLALYMARWIERSRSVRSCIRKREHSKNDVSAEKERRPIRFVVYSIHLYAEALCKARNLKSSRLAMPCTTGYRFVISAVFFFLPYIFIVRCGHRQRSSFMYLINANFSMAHHDYAAWKSYDRNKASISECKLLRLRVCEWNEMP